MIMPQSAPADGSTGSTGSTGSAGSTGSSQSWQYWKRNMVPVIEAPFTNVAEVYGFKGNATPAVHTTASGCKLGTAMYGSAVSARVARLAAARTGCCAWRADAALSAASRMYGTARLPQML